ncbi:MAG: aspartate/glutamate racemase family protein [Tissierellia bacterium]|nr:aspartate/glutamate racemase family protein [Tissierellia bacterium]
MKNKLGIIGGMGPLATSIFFSRIIDSTMATKDQEHIWTVISSHSTMPDRTSVIVEKLNHDVIIQAVSEDIKIMEAANVERISIPCNTFHYFYDEVQSLTDIPIINMIDEAMKEFSTLYGKKTLVLSTVGTKQAGVYEKYAETNGIEILDLDEKYVTQINDLIYEIKSTNMVDRPEFIEFLEELFEVYQPDGIIVACTELSLIPLGKFTNNKVLDAMDVLVRESILQTGYQMK